MLQVNYIRQNPALVKERLEVRNFPHTGLVDTILEIDESLRKAKSVTENLQASVNSTSKEIGMLMAKESEFMDNVKNGTPPTPTTVKEDKLLLPKVNYESEVVKIDSEGWLDAVRTFRLARQLREEAEEVENGAKERLINLMTINNAEVAEGGGIRCYYRESKGRKTFDYKAFMDSHPDMDLQPWFKVGNSSKTFKTYFISRGSAYDE